MARQRHLILILAIIGVFNIQKNAADVHGDSNVKEEDRAFYIGDILVHNQNLTNQIWSIGQAFVNLAGNIKQARPPGPGNMNLSPEKKNSIYNYILDSIPNIIRDDVFQNVTYDVFDEFTKAYDKSDVSKNISAYFGDDGSLSNEALKDVVKHLDIVRVLQRSIEDGKPVIDELRGNDSTVFIAVVNYLIGMAPIVWEDPSFQAIKNIVIEELTLGYNNFLKGKSLTGPEMAKKNSTILVMGVLKYTNLERMLLRSLKAGKPVIDRIRGKDSTVMLMGLGFLAKEYPIIMANPRYQHTHDTMSKYFGETFAELNYTMKDLQTNQKEVVNNVLAKTNKVQMVQDILRGGSARDLLPLMENDNVNDKCYSDAMDFLDSIVEMFPWALKMFDSMGKLREGVMHGQLNLVGSYDECLDITAHIDAGKVLGNRTKTKPTDFNTRYCRVTMDLPAEVIGIDTKGVPVHLTWGACVPNSCHSTDISGMFQMETISNITSAFSNVYVYCFDDRDVGRDDSAVAAIVILSFFALLILLGSLYVMILKYRESNTEENAYELPRIKEESHYTSIKQNGASNGAYFPDSKVDLSENPVSTMDVPPNYMPHAETTFNGVSNGFEKNGSLKNGDFINGREPYKQVKAVERERKSGHGKKREGALARFFKAFALQINAEKVLTGKTGSNSINCIHGIRFFSLTWVILGHTFNYGIVSIPSLWTTENIVQASEMMKRFTFQAVIAGGFAVDTFYMISGMLLTYLQIKQLEKLTGRFKCGAFASYTFNYYFHRIWRLTPMYMMVIMVYSCLMKYFGDGPLWPEAVKSADDCKVNWWTNLLYVNNLVNVDSQCMAWSWFLANDMQFYVVSLFFLVFLALSIKVGVTLIVLLMCGGIASGYYEEQIWNGSFFTTKKDGGGYWNNVYITPWCRVAAYCVGMLLGVILYKRPRKPVNMVLSLIGWVIATAMGLALVYGTYSEYKEGGTEWSRYFRAAYESFGRPLWAACVAWVIFACHNGNGGAVDSILSWKGLVPLSRLSYAAYLVHPIMMMVHVYSKRSLVYISDYEIIYLFLGHTCFTFMVAFVVSVSFEAPFMALEKIITGK